MSDTRAQSDISPASARGNRFSLVARALRKTGQEALTTILRSCSEPKRELSPHRGGHRARTHCLESRNRRIVIAHDERTAVRYATPRSRDLIYFFFFRRRFVLFFFFAFAPTRRIRAENRIVRARRTDSDEKPSRAAKYARVTRSIFSTAPERRS